MRSSAANRKDVTNNPGYAAISMYLPMRAYIAFSQLKALATTGRPLPSHVVLSELFRRDE